MVKRGRQLLWLLVLLVFAVPALLTDLECMVGPANCCACQEAPTGFAPDDCSIISLTAASVPAPSVLPRDDIVTLLPAPPAPPAPRFWGDSEDQRAPREGPPPLASGLRGPPA